MRTRLQLKVTTEHSSHLEMPAIVGLPLSNEEFISKLKQTGHSANPKECTANGQANYSTRWMIRLVSLAIALDLRYAYEHGCKNQNKALLSYLKSACTLNVTQTAKPRSTLLCTAPRESAAFQRWCLVSKQVFWWYLLISFYIYQQGRIMQH